MSKEKIRVLQVGLGPNMGGIENVVRSWNCNLPDDISFDFINIENVPLAFEDEFREKGGKILKITHRRKNPLKSYSELKEIICDGGYDYVHVHMMSWAWYEPLLLASVTPSVKAVAHSHTAGSSFLSFKDRILDSVGRRKMKGKDYYRIACGEAAGRDMFRALDWRIIMNGVDFESCCFSSSERERIRGNLNISDDTLVVGHVGRNSRAKNYPFIISLFADFSAKRPGSRLLLIGDVRECPEIRALVKEKGIEDKVIFTGMLSDLQRYYSAMDVFILPSLYEGVSVSMIEAQVSGLECIVSESVSPDADISGNVKYIPIDNTEDGVRELLAVKKEARNIESLTLDYSFDVKNTSREMFAFYRENLV